MSAKYLPILISTALLATACRIPLCEHPLTDEANARLDERLIGDWEMDFRNINPKFGKRPDEDNIAAYRVLRVDGKANMLMTYVLHDGRVSDESVPLLATHLAMHDYLTWGPFNEDTGQPFTVCMYELDDADHGKIYVLDDSFICDLIERGKAGGKVDRGGGGEVEAIMLAGDSKQLQTLLERHGTRCFDMKNPILCRRMKPSINQQQRGQR